MWVAVLIMSGRGCALPLRGLQMLAMLVKGLVRHSECFNRECCAAKEHVLGVQRPCCCPGTCLQRGAIDVDGAFSVWRKTFHPDNGLLPTLL